MTPSKIALITGAGTGIGRAVALALLREGYSVVLAGRRSEPLQQAAAAAQTNATRTLIVPTDVSDPARVEKLFAKTKETFGRLDLLFNNAGISAPAIPLEDLTYHQWRSVIDNCLPSASSACFRPRAFSSSSHARLD